MSASTKPRAVGDEVRVESARGAGGAGAKNNEAYTSDQVAYYSKLWYCPIEILAIVLAVLLGLRAGFNLFLICINTYTFFNTPDESFGLIGTFLFDALLAALIVSSLCFIYAVFSKRPSMTRIFQWETKIFFVFYFFLTALFLVLGTLLLFFDNNKNINYSSNNIINDNNNNNVIIQYNGHGFFNYYNNSITRFANSVLNYCIFFNNNPLIFVVHGLSEGTYISETFSAYGYAVVFIAAAGLQYVFFRIVTTYYNYLTARDEEEAR